MTLEQLSESAQDPTVWDIARAALAIQRDSLEKDVRIERLTAALQRIAKCEDAPDIDATGEWQRGLYCGVEDRDCQDRYEGADYGHMVGVEKGLEWASNEAKHTLEQIANTKQTP